MNYLAVDVQPAYRKHCDSLVGPLITHLNKLAPSTPIAAFWVDELTGDTEEDVREYWASAGATDDLLERVRFMPKGYGFFRGWMDSGVADEEIIMVACELRDQGLDDSRLLDVDWLAEEAAMGHALQDPIFLPHELESESLFRAADDWVTCGGGRDECLKEVELWLSSLGVPYERLDHLTY